MKILLTSSGLSNDSIANTLEKLVGKPGKDTRVAFIPTAAFCEDDVKHESKDWLVQDLLRVATFCGFLDLVSLADLEPAEVIKRLEYADIIFVGGGNAFYLSYWMEKSGLFDALPRLLESRVYAGISAGSMLATQSLRTTSQAIKNPQNYADGAYDAIGPTGRSAGRTAKLVDFVFRPHLNSVRFPGDPEEVFQSLATELNLPLYALDDESALVVQDGRMEVVSEGTWKLFEPK